MTPTSHRPINTGAMCGFPLEIFVSIFSLLPPRDLPSVIRLSTDFLRVGRYLLYQSVNLKSDNRHIKSTVLLLQQDVDLCKNIKHAALTTTRQPSTTSWIPANFLSGWNDLRSLKMVGVPFHTLDDQEIFRDSLMRSCTLLTHLTYQPGVDSFPGPDFGIPGLKRLSWKTEQASERSTRSLSLLIYKLSLLIFQAPLESQIISVMTSSLKTLTHISFTGHLSLLEPSSYYDFLSLNFPLLTSVELGSLFNTTSQARSNTAITRFIIAHPHIHHLSLGKFRIGTTTFQFDANLLAEDSLLNLRSFEGFPTNITLLTQCNVRCLLQLTTLSLSSDLNDSSLEEMFEAVKTRIDYRVFPSVRNLRFEFPTDLSHRMKTHLTDLLHRKWVDEFNEICPAVVNWYGTLGPVNQASSNFQALHHKLFFSESCPFSAPLLGSSSVYVRIIRTSGNYKPS